MITFDLVLSLVVLASSIVLAWLILRKGGTHS